MPAKKIIKEASILYIEDDAITRKQLSKYFKSECRVLHTAVDGEEGFELYQKYAPDIVITDIEMPKLNGLEMAKKIRKQSLSTQIIIITAYTKDEYLLQAVNLQLTQYLLKPLSIEKITDALKLSSNYLNCKIANTKKVITNNGYYDTYTKELVCNGQIVNLSKHERALIELLLEKHPAPASYESINARIYDYGGSKNAMKLLISALRNKIKKEFIVNVSGFGYKLNLKDDD
ncbi:MAG: response regulator [Pseudomonadales bacterium]|nr:response regulator [Pseudomonadales bacterium]